jgi:hypothetical protein
MICANCGESFKTWKRFRGHKPCVRLDRETWIAHLDAKDRAKHRRARRLARKALRVVRDTAPMSDEVKERLRDPAVRQAAQTKAKVRQAAIRQQQQVLAKAGRRRRRIMT